MTFETMILVRMKNDPNNEGWTTQELTEQIFDCKKGDAVYKNHIEDVTKDMQHLKRCGRVVRDRVNTGRGYCICIWRLL